MRIPTRLIDRLALVALFITAPLVGWSQDVEGSKDHPLFNRLPNYHIDNYRESEFGSYDGFVDSDGSYKTVEGRTTYINYYFDEGTQYLSETAIKRNYRDAFVKIGGVVKYEDSTNVHMSLDRGGKVTWVRVQAWNGGQGVALNIVEVVAMTQHIVADADALAKEIGLTGRAVVHGIFFDTGKSVVKPESDAALAEVVKLLGKIPGLKVYVVGHTDSVGKLDFNLDLSRRRAEAVVDVLVSTHGVDRGRLQAHGVGPLVPASTNRTDEGRAANRRVEIVEQ